MAVNDQHLVDACIEDGDLAKLLRLPEELEDFSESSIVHSLDWILKCDDAKICNATKRITDLTLAEATPWVNQDEDVQSPYSNRKCFVLNQFLCLRFSPKFLQEEARSMSFSSVLELTSYLHFLLSWSPVIPEENTVVPSLEQIIDWLNALIDSHFQQLKLAEDARDIIDSLNDRIELMSKWQMQTKALQGTLAELTRQFEESQRNQTIGDYCIEVISF